MKLSIIIVNWNTCELLAQCLRSLEANVMPLFLDDLETFVVDNGSTDGSPQMIRQQFTWARLISNEDNLGFVKANNQALRQCKGNYVLLLNSDTIVWPNAMERMIDFLDAHPNVGIVGAELRNKDTSLQLSWNQFPSLFSEVCGRNVRARYPYGNSNAYLVDWVGGACMMVRQDVIKRVGLLDENIFMYSEETDWCYRISRAGWHVIYLPGACITHIGGASSASDSARFTSELFKSKLYFFRKHYGRVLMVALKVGFLLRISLQLLISLARSGQRATTGRERYRSLLLSIWKFDGALYENRN